jgi:hypothetical protein
MEMNLDPWLAIVSIVAVPLWAGHRYGQCGDTASGVGITGLTVPVVARAGGLEVTRMSL